MNAMPVCFDIYPWLPLEAGSLIDYVQEMTRTVFLDGCPVDPCFFLEVFENPRTGEQGHFLLVIETKFIGSFEEVSIQKEFFARMVEKLTQKVKKRQAIFVAEAWMASAIDVSKLPDGSLEHHPGRLECVYIVHEQVGQVPLGLVARISDENGIKALGEFESAGDALVGTFSNILRQPPKETA